MKTVQDVVNDSGYPLQIRLEECIKETSQQHKWQVLVREHRWVNTETKEDGYIDLMLKREGFNLRLAIECKRIIGNWTFLVPSEQPNNEYGAKALNVNYKTFNYLWNKICLDPESPEALFCVMETGGKKDSRTLEKLAGELLLSLESLAIEETELIRPTLEKLPPTPLNDHMYYLPIIVTTANLQTINFNPSKIDIKSGKVTESTEELVEFVRFRKNLATHIKYKKPEMYNLYDLNQENDRTVFVVQAESFIKFLSMIGNVR